MMKITNPTEQAVSIVIRGVGYTLAPQETKTLEDSVAKDWQRVHEFLVVEETVQRFVNQAEEVVVKPIETITTTTESNETIVVEDATPVITTTPKKKVSKK